MGHAHPVSMHPASLISFFFTCPKFWCCSVSVQGGPEQPQEGGHFLGLGS